MPATKWNIGDVVVWMDTAIDAEEHVGRLIGVTATMTPIYLVAYDGPRSKSADDFTSYGVKDEDRSLRCNELYEKEILRIAPTAAATSTPVVDGCFCLDCTDFAPMAAPNYNGKFLCRQCRSTKRWKYPDAPPRVR